MRNAAATGHSCGGLQTVRVATDPRISTAVVPLHANMDVGHRATYHLPNGGSFAVGPLQPNITVPGDAN